MDADDIQDTTTEEPENTKHTDNIQAQVKNAYETEGNVQHDSEVTEVGINKNDNTSPLTVDVEGPDDNEEQNNLVKSENVELLEAEGDAYNGDLKSISEVGIETKLEVDPKESKVFIEEVPETMSSEEVKETTEEDREVRHKDIDETKTSSTKVTTLSDEYKEEEIEEEYDEEELDENGEVMVVTKTIMVKVFKTKEIKTQSVISYVEGEEEYEEEEIDDTGESKIVKKTRLVRIPKEKVQTDTTQSFEEVEVEFEEEEVDSKGDITTVTKKRVVKVPMRSVKSKEMQHVGEDEGESKRSTVEKKEVETELDVDGKSVKSEVSVGEGDLEEELAEGEDTKTPEVERPKLEIDELSESGEEDEENEEIKKKKRKRSTSLIEIDGRSKSQPSAASVNEGEKEELEETEGSSVSRVSSTVTISSKEQKISAEKEDISKQFDILLKLRGDHIFLRRKNFSLNNKLVQYFKKQRMEYVFTETKDDQDLDNKFYKKLETFSEHNKEVMEEKINISSEWEAQKQLNEELCNSVKEARENLFEKKKEIGSKMVDSRTGRIINNDKAIDELVGRQDLLIKHLSECCLTEIKLKRRIEAKRRERQMKHMGNDFNLMDYEKLSSLKDYYMDKITERNVEINEVSEKLASMEENMNLVKYRLKRTEDELEIEQLRLQDVSANLLRKRANLNQVKATRHKTEKNTAKIKQQSGLLAYPILLKDYEDKSQQLKDLTSQLESLKQSHRNGIIKIRHLRDSIKRRTAMKFSSGMSGNISAMSISLREP